MSTVGRKPAGRSKYDEREYRVGDYWLSQYGKSPAWQRTWYDEASRQTKRVSLGTADFSEAKDRLTEWFIANVTKAKRGNDAVLLEEVLLAYYHQHAVKVRAGTRIKYHLGHVQAFFTGLSVEEACKPEKVELFAHKLAQGGMKPSSINNVLGVIRAAVNRAYKRGELSSAPFIASVKAGQGQPKGRPLKAEELTALVKASKGHTQLMMILGMATGARPEALVELQWPQVDFDTGTIDLNPEGRVQTQKHRPVVRMPPTLAAILWERRQLSGHLLLFRGKPSRRYHEAWMRAKERAGLTGTVTPYSMRHSVARWCRAKGVPAWEVAAQLGHSAGPRLSITERYTSHSPDYLAQACAALENLLALALRGTEFENCIPRKELAA